MSDDERCKFVAKVEADEHHRQAGQQHQAAAHQAQA
jgi:hypothetical protein